VIAQTFVLCVQGLKQGVQGLQKHFVNYVQKFVMLAQLNAKNYQLTIVAKNVLLLVKNVLKHAQQCKLKNNMLKFCSLLHRLLLKGYL